MTAGVRKKNEASESDGNSISFRFVVKVIAIPVCFMLMGWGWVANNSAIDKIEKKQELSNAKIAEHSVEIAVLKNDIGYIKTGIDQLLKKNP